MSLRITETNLLKLKKELDELETGHVEVDGKTVKPSSCYYIGNNPAHILYNTNCPDMLRHTIEGILQKYITGGDLAADRQDDQ